MNTWKLYKNCKIIPENNFKVDSIATYLAGLTYETITGATADKAPQYIKHDLAIQIKIDKSQSNLDFFNDTYNYNYMSIQNTTDTNPVYYFILKKTWTARETITLVLKMDTVNTFIENTNYVLSNRTLVNREHKNRFKLIQLNDVESSYIVSSGTWTHPTGTTTLVTWTETLSEDYDGANLQELTYTYSLTAPESVTYTYNKNTRLLTVQALYNTAIPIISSKINITIPAISNYIRRVIDLYSEGLTPLMYKTSESEVSSPDGLDWYLVYMNTNEIDPDNYNIVNPINCLVCASDRVSVIINNLKDYKIADVEAGKTYCFLGDRSTNEATITYTTNGTDWIYLKSTVSDSKIRNFGISLYNSKIRLQYGTGVTLFGSGEYHVIDNITEVKIIGGSLIYVYPGTITRYTTLFDIVDQGTSETYTGSETEIADIHSVDRTSSKLIKIIKLPYCPVKYDTSTHKFGSGQWELDATYNMPKLVDLDTDFQNTITKANTMFSKALDIFNPSGKTTESLRDIDYESKLYHSDYYLPKFVYDSFAFNFNLEKMSIEDYYFTLNVSFVTTTTINSKFMFVFTNYTCSGLETQDYNNVMPIARNNELTLYNYQYINYLRTGYRYDLKTKERQTAGSVIGTVLSAVGSIASFASSAVTGGAGVVAGISLATTAISGVINTANTIAQSEQNMNAKLTQYENQAESVAGSDDVDLMSYYTNNRAKLCLYEISPKMKKAMWDVFYYTGYISGEMKVPNLNTRIWFNFVSADLQFEEVKNIPDSCLNDLVTRYKDGVTVLHRHNNKYDFERQYENWETILYIDDPA